MQTSLNAEPVKSSWQNYWDQDDFWNKSELWEINARLFMKNISRSLSFSSSDEILTIGCGAGNLEALLAPHVKSITATDISPRFLNLCAGRCREFGNVSVRQLPETYTNLENLGTFSHIFCVSVVQYYPSLHELRALIESALAILKPGGTLVIADMPQRPSIRHRLETLLQSLREGYFFNLMRDFFKLNFRPSKYRAASAAYPILYFQKETLSRLAQDLGYRAEWIQDPLSIHSGRLNLKVAKS